MKLMILILKIMVQSLTQILMNHKMMELMPNVIRLPFVVSKLVMKMLRHNQGCPKQYQIEKLLLKMGLCLKYTNLILSLSLSILKNAVILS